MSDSEKILDALVAVFAEKVAERVVGAMGLQRADAGALRPLAVVAERLGWSERQLKTFCKSNNVPIYGTRKHPVVDPREVDRAIVTSTPLRVPAGGRIDAIEAGIASIRRRR